MSREDLQPVTHPPSWPPTGQWDVFCRLQRFLANDLHSSALTSHATVLTAGGDGVRYSGIGPQLAPDPPTLRAGRRQETLLLDD